MSGWSVVTTGWSLLCDVIQWMSGWRLRCACMQSAAWTHHNEPQLTACQVRGEKHTIEGRKPDLLNFHQPAVVEALPLTPMHHFWGMLLFWGTDDSLTGAAQIPAHSRFVGLDLLWLTWIRRNKRLHGWLRSGCWNRRRRPSRILRRFCRPPWKMG